MLTLTYVDLDGKTIATLNDQRWDNIPERSPAGCYILATVTARRSTDEFYAPRGCRFWIGPAGDLGSRQPVLNNPARILEFI